MLTHVSRDSTVWDNLPPGDVGGDANVHRKAVAEVTQDRVWLAGGSSVAANGPGSNEFVPVAIGTAFDTERTA